MVPPSLKDLLEITDSKYAVVVAVAKRARSLSETRKKDEDWRLAAMVTEALDELQDGKFNISYKYKGSE
ncbi:MAG: DNA-directed RNA polymerase subunit omega [Syntrophomonadaceae bacterium]|nr:DNA-directed RNA polymerase subunit omega [Syntrophomonadaceae bacterium]